MLPVFFTFVGAAADLGWWYFNESRLQNAADSAVLAGANEIIKAASSDSSEKDKKDFSLTFVNEVPDGYLRFEQGTSGAVIAQGDIVAQQYADRNFSDEHLKNDKDFFKTYSYGDRVNYEPFYYVVELKGKANHLFTIMEKFGDMNTRAIAVARIFYDAPPPQEKPPEEVDTASKKLAAINVVSGNWELEAAKSSNKWKEPKDNLDNYYVKNALNNYDKDKIWINYNSKENTYKSGKNYRYAIVDVKPASSNARIKTNTTWQTTYTDENELYQLNNPDSLIFGFRQDIQRIKDGTVTYNNDADESVKRIENYTKAQFEKDWDIRNDYPYDRKTEIRYINSGSGEWWNKTRDMRIHNIFNISNFNVRSNRTEEAKQIDPYDILWVRIESEAFLPLSMLGINKSSHYDYKSVRQIVLNVNEDNTEKLTDSDGNVLQDEYGRDLYKYRPVVIFYDGPEKIDMNSHIRDSKPVILNLNADFRGILFAPNSPVVINDNGHKFDGFIVAKRYYKFDKNPGSGYSEVTNSYNNHSNLMYVDKYGEVQFVSDSREKCGTYDTFNILSFSNYNYELEEHSQNNLFTIAS